MKTETKDDEPLSPSQVLERLISDRMLQDTRNGKEHAKRDALMAAAQIAIPAILRAASAGNVQCREAAKLMMPYLNKLLEK